MEIVDAPVSGGPLGAAYGSLAVMVCFNDGAFDVFVPVLSIMGSKVIHAGDVGSGTRFKLARNLLHFVSFTAATEAARRVRRELAALLNEDDWCPAANHPTETAQ